MADDDDEAFVRAWEDREMREVTRDLGPIFRRHGVGAVDNRFARTERRRVAALLGNDQAWRAQERLRVAAEIQVRNGEFANIADSLSAPTPEQFGQAERMGGRFRKFRPRLPDGTVREVIAYRRQDVPQAYRMLMAGVIDNAGFRACKWYRDLYETTGLTGRVGSVDYGREVFVNPQARSPFTDRQAEAQDTFRFVRAQIERRHLALLENMVLGDVPVHRAARSARAFHRVARAAFARAVELLVQAREAASA